MIFLVLGLSLTDNILVIFVSNEMLFVNALGFFILIAIAHENFWTVCITMSESEEVAHDIRVGLTFTALLVAFISFIIHVRQLRNHIDTKRSLVFLVGVVTLVFAA